MLKSKTWSELLATAELLEDSHFLAERLRNMALLFDAVDADKAMLCRESAENLDVGNKALMDAIAILYAREKKPRRSGDSEQ